MKYKQINNVKRKNKHKSHDQMTAFPIADLQALSEQAKQDPLNYKSPIHPYLCFKVMISA